VPTFHYGFGFESPRQARNNAAHGWDDEDSQAVLIDADDEASALAWGHEISERFIKILFRDDRVSWQNRFSSWIEPPNQPWPEQQRVAVGVFPDFTSWLEPYKDED
jgi:hypothetical protein